MIRLTIWDCASFEYWIVCLDSEAIHPQEREFHGYDGWPRKGFNSLAAHPIMLIERRGDVVVAWAPAKINLFLEVLARRPDGYHEIATLMVAVTLYDALVCEPTTSDTLELTCDNEDLSVGPDNLILQAGEALRKDAGVSHGARLRLSKRIPMAAGLAGGSTDAAAALAGLNELWTLGLPRPHLAELGGRIGSDVAFFFNTPAAWCTGRGEKVQPLDLVRPLWFVIVCPTLGLSTAEVYRAGSVPEHPSDGLRIRETLGSGNLEELGRSLHNRLQDAADRLRPELVTVRRKLGEAGPAGSLMSGSGTSCFALCRDEAEAWRVAHHVSSTAGEMETGRVYVVRSCL